MDEKERNGWCVNDGKLASLRVKSWEKSKSKLRDYFDSPNNVSTKFKQLDFCLNLLTIEISLKIIVATQERSHIGHWNVLLCRCHHSFLTSGWDDVIWGKSLTKLSIPAFSFPHDQILPVFSFLTWTRSSSSPSNLLLWFDASINPVPAKESFCVSDCVPSPLRSLWDSEELVFEGVGMWF